jgi:hypothetical protein
MTSISFSWDDRKNIANQKKHRGNCLPPYKKVAPLSRYKQYKHHVNSSVKFRFFS